MSNNYEWLAKDMDGISYSVIFWSVRPCWDGEEWMAPDDGYAAALWLFVAAPPSWLLPGQLYRRGGDDDGKSVYAFDGSLWTLVEDHNTERTSGTKAEKTSDVVEHPSHYTSHPSGLECIQITEHMGFLEGNAIKYIWRHKDKGKPVEDLKKARWYIDRLIEQYK